MNNDDIDYELGIHDCGLSPHCDRYRSCGYNTRPLPSPAEIEMLKIIYRKQLEEDGYDETFIQEYLNEKWL